MEMGEISAVETSGLCKTFDNGVTAVKELSFTVKKGEVFGFLGPNGAGKTTTVRLLNGTLIPTSGDSSVLGISSRREEIRKRTSTLAELAQMYESLSIQENLRFFARLYDLDGKNAEERIGELLKKMGLFEKRNLKLGSFSTGMKKRVYLARTLLHQPELLFLDEPTSGLDPDSAKQINALIRRLAQEEGCTIFLCTHNLSLAEGICDSFGFIDQGTLVKWGGREELIKEVSAKDTLIVKTDKAERKFPLSDRTEINSHLKGIMEKGEYILDVSIYRPSLEDLYFTFVGRKYDELD